MTDIMHAAQTLIVRLNAPAQAHSVWVRNVDNEGNPLPSLCVSIRPGWKNKITVPDMHQGIPVVQIPWPKGS